MSRQLKLGFPNAAKFKTVWENQLKRGQLFIPSKRMCPVGEEVVLVLQYKEAPLPVELPGMVKTVRDVQHCAPGQKPGFLVELRLNRRERKALGAYVKGQWADAIPVLPEDAEDLLDLEQNTPEPMDARSSSGFASPTAQDTAPLASAEGTMVSMARLQKATLSKEQETLQGMTDEQLSTVLAREAKKFCVRVKGRNYYQILGVRPSSERKEIRKNYIKYMRRFHPDNYYRRLPDETIAALEEAFQIITEAYETLVDAQSRSAYDAKLIAQARR